MVTPGAITELRIVPSKYQRRVSQLPFRPSSPAAERQVQQPESEGRPLRSDPEPHLPPNYESRLPVAHHVFLGS